MIMTNEETQPAPVVEYGTWYPDGHTEWSRPMPMGVESSLANEVGRAEAQEEYKLTLRRAGIAPDASNRLVFVTRVRTVSYGEVTVVDWKDGMITPDKTAASSSDKVSG